MELLKIENIGLIYQSEDSETAALENISFSVNEGHRGAEKPLSSR